MEEHETSHCTPEHTSCGMLTRYIKSQRPSDLIQAGNTVFFYVAARDAARVGVCMSLQIKLGSMID